MTRDFGFSLDKVNWLGNVINVLSDGNEFDANGVESTDNDFHVLPLKKPVSGLQTASAVYEKPYPRVIANYGDSSDVTVSLVK